MLLGIAALAGLVPEASCEEGPRTKSSWETLVAMDVAQEEGAKSEDDLEVLSRYDIEARWTTPKGGKAVLGASAEYALRNGGLDLRGRWAVRPDKVYWEKGFGEKLHLRLGQQIARWGKLESTPVVDVLNPKDLRFGPLLSTDDARIPVPMARLELGPPALRCQLIAIPFHVPARVEIIGSDWAIFPPGIWEDALLSTGSWGGDPLTAATFIPLLQSTYQHMKSAEPTEWWALEQSWQAQGTPYGPLSGVEGALRLAWEASFADGSFMLAYTREDMPVVTLAGPVAGWVERESWPTKPELGAFLASGSSPVDVSYPYSGMVGLDAATTLGPFGLRAEAGAFQRRTFVTRDLRSTESPEIAGGLGFEYQGRPELRFGAEGSYRKRTALEEPVLLYAEEDLQAAVFLELSLFRERVKPKLAALADLSQQAGLASASLDWRPMDLFSVGLGGFFFFGPAETPRTLDDLLAFEGGPLGLYNDNDAWFLRGELFL